MAAEHLTDLEYVTLDRAEFTERLPQALNVYVSAMGYPSATRGQRASTWLEHINRPGAYAVGAIARRPPADGPLSTARRLLNRGPSDELIGIAYGYRGGPHQWWYEQVYQGLRLQGASPATAAATLADYFELTELHVHPAAQGGGIGETLLRKLLAPVADAKVLLSTPEVAGADNRAWRLYRRLGFTDVLRGFVFNGDRRPFAVLGRQLPLEDSDS